MADTFEIKPATQQDTALLLSFIKELAEYEKLSDEVDATEELLHEAFFGPKSHAEALLGYLNDEPVCFAIFFHNFSTFRGRSGIYLEDLYVKPAVRSQGLGQKMLSHIARIAKSRHCARFEWWVLDWNKTAIDFYKRLGAEAMHEWITFRVTGKALEELAKLV
jgi:GNAT superfamily N-acetyltransferase